MPKKQNKCLENSETKIFKQKCEDVFMTVNIDIEITKLRLLSGLLMGLDPNAVDLEHAEINSLGFMISEISDNLRDWYTCLEAEQKNA